MAKKIFISYSRKDLTFVEKLAKDLIEAGYDVWYDLTEIEGGDRWAQEIQLGINESEVFAIVVSPNSMASEWVEKEYLFASRRGMKIVPLLYELSELPLWLLNIQYIDIVGANYTRNFHQILDAFENYGRRAGDVKPLPLSWRKRFSMLLPYFWALVFLIVMALLLLHIPTSPVSLFAPTATPTATNTATLTPTYTPSPTMTASPTFTATNTPTQTASPTPTLMEGVTPSPTPTLEPVIVDWSGTEMLLVQSGVFLMGSDTGPSDEQPAHIANLSTFYIDTYEVTNADYKECVEDLGCELPKNTRFYVSATYRNHPAVFVTWEMADAYCAWRDARLPTEAEWEKAARGTNSNSYPWGTLFVRDALNYCDQSCDYSWADPNGRDGYPMTAPVGSYEKGVSPYGAYDMAGNAAEWVADWYAADYYRISLRIDPLGPETGLYRILRGGSWYDRATDLHTYTRNMLRPNVGYNYTGFRCATSVGE